MTVRYKAVNALLFNEFLKKHLRVKAQTRATAPQQLQRGDALYDAHRFPPITAHALVRRGGLIKSERPLFDFSQRAVTDASDFATNAGGVKNLFADSFANRPYERGNE